MHLYHGLGGNQARHEPQDPALSVAAGMGSWGALRDTKSDLEKQVKRKRLTNQVVDISLKGADLRLDVFGPREELSLRAAVSIDQIEVFDCVETSPFNKLLCYHHAFDRCRDINESMACFDFVTLRPEPDRAPEREECALKIKLLPLRLNLDQDTVEFLVEFFSRQEETKPRGLATAAMGEMKDAVPVANFTVDTPRSDLNTDVGYSSYVQSFETSPIKICLDYKPKRVDYSGLQAGDYSQLVHLFPLEVSDYTFQYTISVSSLPSLRSAPKTLLDRKVARMWSHWTEVVAHESRAHLYLNTGREWRLIFKNKNLLA